MHSYRERMVTFVNLLGVGLGQCNLVQETLILQGSVVPANLFHSHVWCWYVSSLADSRLLQVSSDCQPKIA